MKVELDKNKSNNSELLALLNYNKTDKKWPQFEIKNKEGENWFMFIYFKYCYGYVKFNSVKKLKFKIITKKVSYTKINIRCDIL
jgi:hypothetical protein